MNVARVLPELYQRSVRIIADAVFGLPDNADTGYFQILVMRIQIVCKIISAPCLYTVIGLKREEPVRFHDKTVGRWIVLAFLSCDSQRHAVNLITLYIKIIE